MLQWLRSRHILHTWQTIFSDGPQVVQACRHPGCTLCRSLLYDIVSGQVYWIPGDIWSPSGIGTKGEGNGARGEVTARDVSG